MDPGGAMKLKNQENLKRKTKIWIFQGKPKKQKPIKISRPLLCLGLLFSAPEQKGVPYWKFAFPDPLGTAEKTLVIVVVIIVPLHLLRIYLKLEILRILKPKVYYTNFF